MYYINRKNVRWYFIRAISNLNLAILLLLMIALLSILGTIIEQDQNTSYYQLNYPVNHLLKYTYILNWKLITGFGIDHIYATWWFLLLLLLFFCSLTTCTFSRQLPGLRKARNWKFRQRTIAQKTNILNEKFDEQSFTNIIYTLNLKCYYVFHRNNSIYGYKGLSGRIAPIFVHFGIILTLTGAMIGFFSGFMAQQMIPTGEIFHIQNVIKSGLKSRIPDNIVGKINNFHIDYNNNKSIKQFYSNISLIDNSCNYLSQKEIYVNSPLKFRDMTFYQTDWLINGLRVKLNINHTLQLKLNKSKIGNTNIWVYNLPIDKNDYLFFIITNLKDPILIYNQLGQLIKAANINEVLKINNNNFSIIEVMTGTGIQIKTDPGITIVYTGFFILMISIVISYLSYSQIWSYNDNINKKFIITGETNRAKLAFNKELAQIKKIYFQLTL